MAYHLPLDKLGYGYSFSISSSGSSQTATIHSSWTSGLAVHPVGEDSFDEVSS